MRLAPSTGPARSARRPAGSSSSSTGRQVVKVRGDADDVFSAGFICPKGASIGELHADPDRLTTPLVRRDGELVEASWDEAFAAIDAKLRPILAAGDRDATAIYLGNPNAHTLDGMIHLRALIKAIGSRNVFSASSVDQTPQADLLGADVRRRALGPGARRRPRPITC